MLEVERVAHKLKVNKVNLDGKEWRAHMDQTKKYHEQVRGSLPEVRGKLERLSEDVSKALEKIAKKESVLTRSFQGMTGDYRAHSEKLKDIQSNFHKMTKNVQDLENELMEVNDRLTKIQGKIDDTGKSFSDNSPLHNIKKSIVQVKNDIKNIDIRIGVVSNTLLQLKLKERSKQIEDGKPMDILDNEYELEV
jgi:estrogen-related receptor beta like 1